MKSYTLDEINALVQSLPDGPDLNFYPVNAAALARLAREAPDARQRDLYRKVEEIDDEEFERGITPFTGITRYVGKIARPDVVNLPIYGPGWALLVALPSALEPLITSDGEERKKLRNTVQQDILRDFHLRAKPLVVSISGRVKATEFQDTLVPRIRLAERSLVEAAADFWFAVDSDGLRADGRIVIEPTPDADPLRAPRKALYAAVYDYVGLRLLHEEIRAVLGAGLPPFLQPIVVEGPPQDDVALDLDRAGWKALRSALILFERHREATTMADLVREYDLVDGQDVVFLGSSGESMESQIRTLERDFKVNKHEWQHLKGREKLRGRLALLAVLGGWAPPRETQDD